MTFGHKLNTSLQGESSVYLKHPSAPPPPYVDFLAFHTTSPDFSGSSNYDTAWTYQDTVLEGVPKTSQIETGMVLVAWPRGALS